MAGYPRAERQRARFARTARAAVHARLPDHALGDLTIEPLLRWYRQNDARDATLTRITPGLHLLWRVKERFSLEAEGDWEQSKTTSPVIVDNVHRRF